MAKRHQGSTNAPPGLSLLAREAHAAGDRREAERLCRLALESAPRDADALALIGIIALENGRPEEALRALAEAARRRPGYDIFLHQGLALRAAGRLGEAAQAFARAASRRRDDALAPFEKGATLLAQGRAGEAVAAFAEAASRQPASARLPLAAARALIAAGLAEAGAAFLRRAALAPADAAERRAARELFQHLTFTKHEPAAQDWLAQWLAEPGEKPAWLAPRLAQLLRLDPALAAALAAAGGGQDFAAEDVPALEPVWNVAALRALMAEDLVYDAALERLLAALRPALVGAVARGDALGGDAQAFLMALAILCHGSEFALPEDKAGPALARSLAAGLGQGAPPALVFAAIGCYRPLAAIAGDRAARAPGDAAALALWRRLERVAIAEPRREAELRRDIAELTPIRDATSCAVAAQYEESPYPRWFAPPAPPGIGFAPLMRAMFPGFPFGPGALAPRRILVAGCGSGYHAFTVARLHPEAQILALDLSRANLAYARRAQEQAGIANIDFRRGDILELGTLERDFDLVDCIGVLHHLRDPEAGFRILAERVRPGGLLRIGLYSATARAALEPARALIAAGGYAADAAGLRRFRRDVMALPAEHGARAALLSSPDFFALSGLRDLLFHVEEHGFTIAQIAALLARLRLRFVGFDLSGREDIRQAYLRRHRDDPGLADLAAWEKFEAERPDSFAQMYIFLCAKPG